jgi:two-component system chemotaxis response regulator CheY
VYGRPVETPLAAQKHRRTILVIEDDAGIRESLVECLATEGFDVLPATNGVDGLARLRARRPNLVVLDLVMPVMNGAEFLDAVSRDAALADVPVLLMTAAMPPPGATLPRVSGYLAKPFELDELLEAVERHCAPAA